MNVQLQHQRMSDDALNPASTVAEEVWDKCEVEIEEATADSHMFDMAKSTQMALSSVPQINPDTVAHALLTEMSSCR